MQCNTNYEGTKENARYQNLDILQTFRNLYPDSLVGLSCHMPGAVSSIAAVSLGPK